MKNKIIFITLFIILLFSLSLSVEAQSADSLFSGGNGDADAPYLISTPEDLIALSEAVAAGESFEGKTFLQTCSINMKDIEFSTIGKYEGETYFCGIYDGGGNYLEELTVKEGGNNSLFGALGGTVMNLGIESGTVNGHCVGSIASHSSRRSATIINCYNKATVIGERAGGIADNFNGNIVGCWTDCTLDSIENTGGIFSYTAAFCQNCYYSGEKAVSEKIDQTGAEFFCFEKKSTTEIVDSLNRKLYQNAKSVGIEPSSLNTWRVDENGNIRFSTEKFSLSIRDLPAFISVNISFVVLGMAGAGCIFLLFVPFLDCKRKNNEEYKF